MKREDRNLGRDLNANPNSDLNRNRPSDRRERFPESNQAKDEMERRRHSDKKDDENIELLAQDVKGTVSSRDTSTDPEDIAGVSDLDQGMRRSRRRS